MNTDDDPNNSSTLKLLRVLVVLVIVGLAGLALLIALSGCTSRTPGGDPAVTASGTLTLRTTSLTRLSATECAGSGGYSDIQQGAQVSISDGTGKTLAIGQLSAGDVGVGQCQFTFQMKVPGGEEFYQVEITHRGKVQFTKEQLQSMAVTLGNG